MKDKSLLEVSMMLGDAIDRLNALSAYKPHDVWKDSDNADNQGTVNEVVYTCPECGADLEQHAWEKCEKVPDPYAHLKEAHAKGEQIQCKEGGVVWKDYHSPLWTYDPSCYRIKPKTKTLYLWAYRFAEKGDWNVTDRLYSGVEEIPPVGEGLTNWMRLDYTAIEVDA